MMAIVGYCYKSLGRVSFFVFIKISITLESYIFIDETIESRPLSRRHAAVVSEKKLWIALHQKKNA